MPLVELLDGRFMTDTTPMIAWFEAQHPEPPVIPRDPLLAFASRLLEDYAEEWLWRTTTTPGNARGKPFVGGAATTASAAPASAPGRSHSPRPAAGSFP